jgi:hypothetical protein
MAKYLIEVEVNEDKLRMFKGIDVGEENEYEELIESLISQEMAWVEQSGIYLSSVNPVSDNNILVDDLGNQLSEIINQDGDEKTDGECLDEVIDLLKVYGIYKERV